MKEESLKKIMQNSTVETSEDFINNLMNAIEVSKEQQKIPFWNSFRFILVTSSVFMILATGILFKLLDQSSSFLSILKNIPKIPVFSIITILLFYTINSIIRVRELSKNTHTL
ncbi:hypothetical protein [uncultured Dokdonia sp.]|uniref:hypothetical protein n=1 Tax=uncultured Dokdonia sp. TaxID=575653 RepID=UPI0026228C4D|nr:hypothetical protein [uncultured Dokdonia sp.]